MKLTIGIDQCICQLPDENTVCIEEGFFANVTLPEYTDSPFKVKIIEIADDGTMRGKRTSDGEVVSFGMRDVHVFMTAASAAKANNYEYPS